LGHVLANIRIPPELPPDLPPEQPRDCTFETHGYAIVGYDADALLGIWQHKSPGAWDDAAGDIHADRQRHRRQSNLGEADLPAIQAALPALAYEVHRPCFIFTSPQAQNLDVQHPHRDFHPDFVIAAFDEPVYVYVWPLSHRADIPDEGIASYVAQHPRQRVALTRGQALLGDALLLHAGAGGDCPPRFHCFLLPKTRRRPAFVTPYGQQR